MASKDQSEIKKAPAISSAHNSCMKTIASSVTTESKDVPEDIQRSSVTNESEDTHKSQKKSTIRNMLLEEKDTRTPEPNLIEFPPSKLLPETPSKVASRMNLQPSPSTKKSKDVSQVYLSYVNSCEESNKARSDAFHFTDNLASPFTDNLARRRSIC